MSRINSYVVFAGAALCASSAIAGEMNLDIDRAYASELRADAATRTSLLQSGGSGHDGKFHIGDGTGNYRLNVGGLLQFRYTADFRDDQPDNMNGGSDDDFTHGFSTPRTQLHFSGNIINPQITFLVVGDFGQEDNDAGNFRLRDAWGQYNFDGEGDGFAIRWGQMKAPVLYEENMFAGNQLAVERSQVNEFFTQDYSQGVAFMYTADSFKIAAAASDGANTDNTQYNSAAEADISLTLRADVKFEGDWDQFADFTSWRNSDMAIRVGGAVHWQQSGDTNPSAANSADALLYTADVQVEGNGWNAFAAFIGSSIEVPGGEDVDDFGFIVQGGLFLSDNIELFARYDMLALDDNRQNAMMMDIDNDEFSFLTVGANYYFVPESHAAKLTVDVVWALDETSELAGQTSVTGNSSSAFPTGLLGDMEDGEFLIRGQMQLIF